MKRTCGRAIKRHFLILLCFAASIGMNVCFAQTAPVSPDGDDPIEVNIQFFDRRTYYVGDPIVVEFQISNKGVDPYLFITSYNEIFTFDLSVSTFSNREVERSVQYSVERNRFAPVLNDEIALKPFEVYGVRIDISRWFDLTEPGEYLVRGHFYPHLISDPTRMIDSENELLLALNPAFEEPLKEKKRADEIAKIKAEKRSADEVVEFMIESLMAKDFEKYFIYINFDKFIMQFDNAKRKYTGARDKDKPAVVEEFKAYLRGENKLENIPYTDFIPVNYTIKETFVNNEKHDARVTVEMVHRFQRLEEKKRYTYYLHQYGDKWLLERYQVVNIGS